MQWTTYVGTCEITVCVDCVMFLANGEVTNGQGDDITTEHAAAMAAVWGESFDITLGSLECEACKGNLADCEPWFSSSRCGGCHSDLGGDRQHAVAWLTDAQGNDTSIPTSDRFDPPLDA